MSNLKDMTKDKLKTLAKEHKQLVGGNKDDLIARLMPFYPGGVVPAQSGAVPLQQAPAGVPGYQPLMTPPAQQPLPLAPPAVPTAPKTGGTRQPKDQHAALVSAVRNSGQTFEFALSAVLSAYGTTDLAPQLLVLIGEQRRTLMPVPLHVEMNEAQLRTLKVEDLKSLLRERKQTVGGKKEELIFRLLNPEPAKTQQQLPPPGLTAPAFGVPAPLPAAGDLTVPQGNTTPLAGGVPLPAQVMLPPATGAVQSVAPTLPAGLPQGLPVGMTVPTGLPLGDLPQVPGVGLPMAGLPTVPGVGLPGAVSPRSFTVPTGNL